MPSYQRITCPGITLYLPIQRWVLLEELSHSASQEIPHLLWNLKVPYYMYVCNRQSQIPIQSPMIGICTLPPHFKSILYHPPIGFGGLEVACWPLVPKFAGSNPAEAVGFLRAKKILSTPSFGGEVKPSVPCRRFAACKRSLELRGSRILDEICRKFLAHEESHLPLLGVSRVVGREGT